jgi:peptidoglycan/LPS O-acetylase OafA/YrhL
MIALNRTLQGEVSEKTGGRDADRLGSDPSVAHRNNFDLIRLLAALQVMFCHGVILLHIGVGRIFVPPVMTVLLLFPGVPIFFCVSGFLIARSVERHLDALGVYLWSRALRIYPALWLCVVIGGATLLRLGFFHGVSPARVAQWWFLNLAAGGASVNPDYLRSFGPGVWNGSLWTIFIELSFYAALPVVYLLCRRLRVPLNAVLVSLLLASFVIFIAAQGLEFGDTKLVGTMQKLVWFSLAGNLWMFLFGTLAHRYWDRLVPFIQGKFLFWLAAYLSIVLILSVGLEPAVKGVWFGAGRLFICRGSLGMLVLSAAYSNRALSNRLLHRNDLSYGIYLYHAFIFALFIHFGRSGLLPWIAGMGMTLGAAALSWFLIERKALGLKFAHRRANGATLGAFLGRSGVPN